MTGLPRSCSNTSGATRFSTPLKKLGKGWLVSSTTDFFGVHSACSVAARASYPPHTLREKATAAEARYKQVYLTKASLA